MVCYYYYNSLLFSLFLVLVKSAHTFLFSLFKAIKFGGKRKEISFEEEEDLVEEGES